MSGPTASSAAADPAPSLHLTMRQFVRTRWASDLGHRSRSALTELADRDGATVSGRPTGTTEDGRLNINSATALVLLRQGYAEEAEDGGIVATEDGLRKIGKIPVDRGERRRKSAAAALEAQASGEWRPVPAGYSAAAERDAKESKRWWSQAVRAVHAAKANLSEARRMLKLSEQWGAEADELAACREDVVAAEKGLADAEATLRSLKGDAKRAA